MTVSMVRTSLWPSSVRLAVGVRQFFFHQPADLLAAESAAGGLAQDLANPTAEYLLARFPAQPGSVGGDLHALAAPRRHHAASLQFLEGAGHRVGVDREGAGQLADAGDERPHGQRAGGDAKDHLRLDL